MKWISNFLFALLLAVQVADVSAEPWAAPGDTVLRNDLRLLDDVGAISIPLSAWPVSWGDVHNALAEMDASLLSADAAAAFMRVRRRSMDEIAYGELAYRATVGAASNPRIIRSFENTPREEGEIGAALMWTGERFAVNLSASYVANPVDGDEFRPDGTYVGMALGNWMLSAGWQERWWGPGNAGSLILSSNARPSPGVSIQRNNSTAFESKWLRWVGPWTLTSFMNLLDDDREIDDALLFGMRFSFKPINGLQIGLSRTAQWCGDGRPCDLETFGRLLVGKDNQGVNVAPEDEPGNQLAGIDIRWTLPRHIPVALYLQWIGEDGRQGQAVPGDWLRQAGAEVWGTIAGLEQRTFIEVVDTACHKGGIGFSEIDPNCAYNHSIYRTGYRYNGRSIGHSIDGDGRSYSVGSTLVQSAGHSWNFLLRTMDINRVGLPNPRHTLSATPQEIVDIQISHDRMTAFGIFKLGVGHSRVEDEASATTSNETSAFFRWSSR